ncbi:spore coat protein [Paenibacillus septentrionalis]|uniref:Spore coat protein n=1 Tax=Paenibacillus septentrionalis TaxID=429342 RepID=A0ABW1V165_9BACL
MANNQLQLTEDDLVGVVLSDLKRVVREYATAATESSCPETRQMFTNLLNSTLMMQGQLFTAMSQANMYEAPSTAPKKELDKQIQSYTQMAQQTQSWLQQGMQAGAFSMQEGNQMQSTTH